MIGKNTSAILKEVDLRFVTADLNPRFLHPSKEGSNKKKKKRRIIPLKAERGEAVFSGRRCLFNPLPLAVKFRTCVHTRLSVSPFEGQPSSESMAFVAESVSKKNEGDLAVFGPIFPRVLPRF